MQWYMVRGGVQGSAIMVNLDHLIVHAEASQRFTQLHAASCLVQPRPTDSELPPYMCIMH
jgi:hypothetical protein